MKRLSIAVIAAIASGAIGTTAADAQSWGYGSYGADSAYRSADVHNMQARKDRHAANVAASYGDYAAADAYARAATVRNAQARHDVHVARYEGYGARRNYWRGEWGY